MSPRWCWFNPWPRNFHIRQAPSKKKENYVLKERLGAGRSVSVSPPSPKAGDPAGACLPASLSSLCARRGRAALPPEAPGAGPSCLFQPLVAPTSGLAGPSLRSQLHPILTRLRRRARPCPRSAFLFKDTGPWTQGHAHPNRTCPDPGPAAHWLTGAWPASRPLVPSCKMGMLSPLRGPWGGGQTPWPLTGSLPTCLNAGPRAMPQGTSDSEPS
mgnify:CR=1 FL=1